MRDRAAAGAALAALLVSGLLTGAALSAPGSGLGVRTEATVTVVEGGSPLGERTTGAGPGSEKGPGWTGETSRGR
ncbi:hypothetical protein ACFY2T_16210 [Streptomyces sp. NPDC001260]|uniref:hypothetical protein n=1 Tax=Streptomyces sp. NPDC001260 TaxID=3364551 RepID=UPI0036969F9D